MKVDLVSFACPGCGDLGIFCFNGVEGRKEGKKNLLLPFRKVVIKSIFIVLLLQILII